MEWWRREGEGWGGWMLDRGTASKGAHLDPVPADGILKGTFLRLAGPQRAVGCLDRQPRRIRLDNFGWEPVTIVCDPDLATAGVLVHAVPHCPQGDLKPGWGFESSAGTVVPPSPSSQG